MIATVLVLVTTAPAGSAAARSDDPKATAGQLTVPDDGTRVVDRAGVH